MKNLLSPSRILGNSAPVSRGPATIFLSRLVRSVVGILLSCLCLAAHAQTYKWTWMAGSSTVGGNGWGNYPVYGTLGTPAPGINPGSREGAASWTDSSGNFWLFGGDAFAISNLFAVSLNDLWEFNPSTNEWAWMGGSSVIYGTGSDNYGQPGVYGTLGVPATGNIPGARDSASAWTDSSGNLWLFGGEGVDANHVSGYLNDLWEFNPSTNEWAWTGGSSTVPSAGYGQPGQYGTLGTPAAGNIPGGREFALSWTDSSGHFWLYGGSGFDANDVSGWLDDLWEFNPSTNEWAWMCGSSTVPNAGYGQPGVYGTLDTPAAGNIPGGRSGAASWTDSGDHLWLFGGDGYDANDVPGYLNDLWEFNPSTSEWAWMGGSSTVPSLPGSGRPGVYGTLGTPVAGDIPGGRGGVSSSTDSRGNIWLFGGRGYDANDSYGALNDLWEFNPSTNEWTWMGGSSTVVGEYGCQPGVYGTLGVPAAGNTPGGRGGALSWADSSGNLWLFGGYGCDANGTWGSLSDLWTFTMSGIAPPAVAPVFSPAAGAYTSVQTVTISDATAGAIIYYTTDGTTPTTSSTVYSSPITVSSTETLKAIATATGWTTSAVATAAYIITPQAAAPTFSVPAGTYTSPQTLTISDATPGATIYYTTNGTTPTTGSTVYSSPIAVSTTETLKAIATATGCTTSAVASAAYTINLPPTFTIAGTAVTVAPGAITGNTSTITVTPSNGFTGTVSLSCAITPTAASDPATCRLPASVTISGSTAQTATLTVNTTAATSALNPTRRLFWPSAGGAALACILLVGIPARRRRWQSTLGVLVLLFSITGGALSCGGSGGRGNHGTTPGTYTITVTGTLGATTQTGTVSLKVQ